MSRSFQSSTIYDPNTGTNVSAYPNAPAPIPMTRLQRAQELGQANVGTPQVAGSNNGALTGLINQGFLQTNENLNQGFTQTNENLNQGFVQTNENLGQGFLGVNEAVQAGTQAGIDATTALGTGLGERFGGVENSLGALTNNLDTYYAGLASNQDSLLTGMDQANAGITDFHNDYTTRTNASDRVQTELIDSVAGNASNTQQMIDNVGSKIGSQVQALGTQAIQGDQTGGNGQTGNQQQQQPVQHSQQFLTSLNSARMALRSQALNPAMQQSLGEFASAFTPDGQFVPQGADMNNVPTMRRLNENGTMDIFKSDAFGQFSYANSLDLNQAMQIASQVPQGFMSPIGASY